MYILCTTQAPYCHHFYIWDRVCYIRIVVKRSQVDNIFGCGSENTVWISFVCRFGQEVILHLYLYLYASLDRGWPNTTWQNRWVFVCVFVCVFAFVFVFLFMFVFVFCICIGYCMPLWTGGGLTQPDRLDINQFVAAPVSASSHLQK